MTQRPDSSILDTATRAQLSGRISFRLEDTETAVMAFPDFEDPTVLLTCKPGVGWMRKVGEKARRFRSVYLSDHWGVADAPAYSQPKIDLSSARRTGLPTEARNEGRGSTARSGTASRPRPWRDGAGTR